MGREVFNSGRRTAHKSIQRKKHMKQMSKRDKNICVHNFKMKFNNFTFTKHAVEKMQTYFDVEAVIIAMYKEEFIKNIIEFNITKLRNGKHDQRLLIRHPDIVTVENKKCYQYFVYSLTQQKIITVYYNTLCDNRDNVDMSYYTEELKIFKLKF